MLKTVSKLAKAALKGMPKPVEVLPTIHNDNASEGNGVVQMVDRLRDEARLMHGPVEREALNAIDTYMGNQWDLQRASGGYLDSQRGTIVYQTMINSDESGADLVKPVLNRTQNAILSNTEARTSRPVQIRITPEETGEDAEFWLSRKGAKALMQLRAEKIAELAQALITQESAATSPPQVDPTTGQPMPMPELIDEEAAQDEIDATYPNIEAIYDEEHGLIDPLTDKQVQAVENLILAGLLKPEHLQKIDDEATADELQRVISALNRDANLDGKYLRAANYSTAGGYCFWRFSYLTRGQRKNRVSIETMPIKSVWIDPYHDDIADCDYAGEDRLVSLERAKVMYPELGDELLESAAANSSMDTETGMRGENYHRDMLQITTCWIRHHTVPVSIERAINEGWVTSEAVMIAETDEETGEQKETPLLDEETGRPKTNYVLTKAGAEHVGGSATEGEKVEPQNERDHGTNWPDAEGLRQVVTISGVHEPVQDVRCPYWDIPLVLFINVPRIDGSPLGQGDAQRLEDTQREINRLMAIIINNQRYSQSPTMVYPQTVYDLLASTGVGFFLDPGGYNVMPDHVFWNIIQNGGFNAMVVNPPELSESLMSLLTMLLAEHDTLSGNVGVRQGRNPAGVTAGVAIAQLQEHATGTLALKARLDEHALTRFGRLEQHAIVSWMPETEWMKISSKYALPALRRIIERAGASDFNIQVSVAAGRGIAKQLDRAQTLEMFNSGLLPLEDTLAELEVDDPAGKAKKILQERGAQASQGTASANSTALDQYAPGPK